jgi:hypothetical protein
MAGPDCSKEKFKDHPSCQGGGDTDQYDFKVIFEGSNPLLLENHISGVPWELSSVTGGHGNIGPSLVGPDPIPFFVEEFAAIGDHAQPCGIVAADSCANRLVGNFTKDKLTFRKTEGSVDPILGNVHMYNGLYWFDSTDMTEYHYGAKVYGYADLVAHPWDPTDPNFCVPIEFTHVWIMQSSPIIKQRQKQCRESEFFAICEADVNEGQYWFEGGYRATIWRADHPAYAEEESPLIPPCGFDS